MADKLIDIDRNGKDFHHKHVQKNSPGDEGVFNSHAEASESMDLKRCYIMAVDSDDLWFVLCGPRPTGYGERELDKWLKGITIKGRIGKDNV